VFFEDGTFDVMRAMNIRVIQDQPVEKLVAIEALLNAETHSNDEGVK